MIDMIIDIVFGLVPWLFPAFFLFSSGMHKKLFNTIFAGVIKRSRDAYLVSEVHRRDALLAEMKRLGYDRDAATVDDLDRMYELFKEEFPVLYEDKE